MEWGLGRILSVGNTSRSTEWFGLLFTKAHRAQAGTRAVFILTVVLIIKMLRVDERTGSRDDFPKDHNFCKKEENFLGMDQ